MANCHLLLKDNITFNDHTQALNHIAETLIAEKIVKPSYSDAIFAREAAFPTGIMLDGYAVAIPHCEAEHAIKPAIYIIKTESPVAFYRADDDGTVDVSIIMALVVTDPNEQLSLLRILFRELQDQQFYQTLLNSSLDEVSTLFQQKILNDL